MGNNKKPSDNSILHRLINEERHRHRLPWVRWNQSFYEFAKDHSIEMAKAGRLYHSDPHELNGGRECVAFCDSGTVPPQEILKCWLSSRGHRENIMAYDIELQGIGISKSKHGTYVTWVGR